MRGPAALVLQHRDAVAQRRLGSDGGGEHRVGEEHRQQHREGPPRRLGDGARGEAGGLRLLLRYYDGPSPVGEFFLTDERFWGLEVVAEF